MAGLARRAIGYIYIYICIYREREREISNVLSQLNKENPLKKLEIYLIR